MSVIVQCNLRSIDDMPSLSSLDTLYTIEAALRQAFYPSCQNQTEQERRQSVHGPHTTMTCCTTGPDRTVKLKQNRRSSRKWEKRI